MPRYDGCKGTVTVDRSRLMGIAMHALEAPATRKAHHTEPQAWSDFVQLLAVTLDELAEDQFLILNDKVSRRYVQFASQGENGLRMETASNRFLTGRYRLNREQIAALAAIGWQAPRRRARKAAPDAGDAGSPNFYVDFDYPADTTAVAHMAVRTLCEVLAVPAPDRIEYRAFHSNGTELCFDGLGIEREQPAPVGYLLGKQVLDAVRKVTGIADLAAKANGNVHIRYGRVLIGVLTMGRGSWIRLIADILDGVRESKALLRKLNRMNGQHQRIHFFLHGDTVFAAIDVPADPFVPRHLELALAEFSQVADGVATLLEAEREGRAAPDSDNTTPTTH